MLQGHDPTDPVCSDHPAAPVSPALERGIDELRIAVARGHFAELAEDVALDAVATVAAALGATREVILPEAHRARAAAILITACEAASFHRDDLRRRPGDFDPTVVERLLAGASTTSVSRKISATRARYHARNRCART